MGHFCRRASAFAFVFVLLGCDKKADDGAQPPAGGGSTPGQGEEGAQPPEPSPSPDPEPAGERTPMIAADHPLHGRFEGTSGPNDCQRDADCHKAGCGGEICSATTDMMSTCEVLPVQLPPDAACGCVEGACQWWSPSGAKLGDSGSSGVPAANQGEAPSPDLASCNGQQCKPGQTCVEYYGIAGPSGPKFHGCEFRCRKGEPNDGCPKGTKCATVADGPGEVCR